MPPIQKAVHAKKTPPAADMENVPVSTTTKSKINKPEAFTSHEALNRTLLKAAPGPYAIP